MNVPAGSSTARMTHRADVAAVVAGLLADLPDVKGGQMFGVPAYFTGGRLFACVYRGQVGLKLPEARVSALSRQPGFGPFRPFGKLMSRTWIAIEREEATAYADDRDLLLEAIHFAQARASKAAARPDQRMHRR